MFSIVGAIQPGSSSSTTTAPSISAAAATATSSTTATTHSSIPQGPSTIAGLASMGTFQATISKAVLDAVNAELDAFTASTTGLVKGILEDAAPTIADRVSDKLSRRIEDRKSPDFKREGNKRQFKNYQGAIDTMDSVSKAILADDKDTAIKALAEGKKKLQYHQKLLRIADQEDLGWAVVNKFMTEENLDDSDEENKLKRARKEAEQEKGKKSKSNNNRGRGRGTGRFRNAPRDQRQDSCGSYRDNNRDNRFCNYCRRPGHIYNFCFQRINGCN